MYKLKFGQYEMRIELTTGTQQDNFWTVQVEIGTVRDVELTKSGEIFGQYMLIFFNKLSWIVGMYKLKLGQYKTIFGQYKSNLGRYKMLIQQNQVQFWTVHGDFFNKISWILGIDKSKLGQYKTIFGQYKLKMGQYETPIWQI